MAKVSERQRRRNERVRLKGKQPVGKDQESKQKEQKQHEETLPKSVGMSKSQRRARATGLTENEVRSLMSRGWPIAMFNLLSLCMSLSAVQRTCDATEFFSGIGSIAKRWTDNGYASMSFDRIDGNRFQDLSQSDGFLTSLWMTMCMAIGGLCHWGTVCSSWVFMSRATSGRTGGHPWGLALDYGSTSRPGNIMVSRMILLLPLLEVRQVWWILEQPITSMMDQVDLWECLTCRLRRIHTCMGAFGGETKKPTWLLSTQKNKWFLPLARSVPKDMHFDNTDVVVRHEDGRVSGGKGLKETQAYPSGYSEELLRLWKANKDQLHEEICSSVSDTDYQEIDDAEWALLDICSADFGVSSVHFQC